MMDIKKTISSITVSGLKDLENRDMYEHTATYSLPLYTDDTPSDLRDGYNRAMVMIDRLIHQLETLIRETKGANQ